MKILRFLIESYKNRKNHHEGHHDGIVTPEQFEQVQAEILRRSGMQKYSGVGLFSSIIKCSECGGWYGSKIWHSNSKYRRVIYQCNNKYKKHTRCHTPHITEEILKEKFVLAINELFSDKEEMVKKHQDHDGDDL
jgi:hypothetical protein